jgi:hypothetical protein
MHLTANGTPVAVMRGALNRSTELKDSVEAKCISFVRHKPPVFNVVDRNSAYYICPTLILTTCPLVH